MNKFKVLFTVILLATCTLLHAQQPSFIPQPGNLAWLPGTFQFDKKVSVSIESATLRPAALYLTSILQRATQVSVEQKKKGGTIVLALSDNLDYGSYMLTVSRTNINITGGDYQGVVAGISTLRQMLPEKFSPSSQTGMWGNPIPCCKILDRPRFEYRGMELDCSRHFFSKQEVMELLDVLALYKINKFHWHLTDDQGWRIEIKKYPRLTEVGGWRNLNNQDSICIRNAENKDNSDFQLPREKFNEQGMYGGYYTQDDIREIVDFARQRGIDIIPEIDMPGHSLCAIHNYDGLSCFKQTGWGDLFSTPLCPGKDQTLEFCKDVWREVFELFPYHYVHIGGDEVDMTNWKKCPDCQLRMRQHRLKTEPELQAWFLHEMEQFFNENGRDMIGWDEIIDGGLSATSTVMWWRTWNPTAMKKTTSHGNNIILTPNSPFYLDYDEGKKTLAEIYDYDAQPTNLNAAEQDRVLGVQGNLWTEWVPTRQRLYYMAFPRMLAVAELGWSRPQYKNYDDFRRRLLSHYDRMQQLGVTYRRPDLEGFYNTNVFTDRANVAITCHDPSAIIRYTTDGSIPQPESAPYLGPITIDKTTHFTFRTFSADGHKGDYVSCDYLKEDFALAKFASPQTSVKGKHTLGLTAKWYDYRGPRCADIDKARLRGTYVTPGVSIPREASGNIGLVITGYIDVPADDIYTFCLLSDDGSYLKIDDKMVVDNDGEHSPRELIGQHAMRKGLHPIYARYFDHNGGQLRLNVLDGKGNPVPVGFWH